MIRIVINACIYFVLSLSISYSSDLWELQVNNNPRLFNTFKVDKTGTIWTGNREGLACYDGQIWKKYTTENSGLSKGSVFTLDIDNEKVVWIGYGLYSKGGLTSYDGSVWKQYTKDNSPLTNDFITSISVDRDNIKWVGTTGGLFSFDGKMWKSYAFADSAFMSLVYSSIVDDDNVKWFFWGGGLYNYQGIACFDGNGWSVYNKDNSGLRGNYIASMAIDKVNRKWFAYGLGKGGGISSFDGHQWVSYTVENSGLCYDTVLSLAVDSNNILWCGTMNGISSFDGKTWKTYREVQISQHETVTFSEIHYIGVGQDNSKWFDTNRGLWRFKEDTMSNVLGNTSSPVSIRLSLYPNPFNPSTTVSFSLSSTAAARLAVYDITGRRVRTLVSGRITTGNHSAVWDGRDDAGRSVSSGVYIARIESGRSVQSMKMLLMR